MVRSTLACYVSGMTRTEFRVWLSGAWYSADQTTHYKGYGSGSPFYFSLGRHDAKRIGIARRNKVRYGTVPGRTVTRNPTTEA